MSARIPFYADIEAASRRLAGVAVRAPLLRSHELDRMMGATILLKAECLQRTGSFKFRGAYNRLSQLSLTERKGGVVAWSSGNHAQGVAAAAELLGMNATIVMPADAPAVKIAKTRSYGAEVVLYDRATEDREAIGRRIAKERGAVIVPPYDDPDVIAGQGTAGLEIVQQAKELGLTVDDVLAPASGGGLIAGVGLAIRAANPSARIYCVEPAGCDDHGRSLVAGSRQSNPSSAAALCDALLAPTPGELTWALNGRGLTGAYTVTDRDVRSAVRMCFETLKLVIEPSGGIALAAVLNGQHPARGRTVAVVLSGGNVEPGVFLDCLGPVMATKS